MHVAPSPRAVLLVIAALLLVPSILSARENAPANADDAGKEENAQGNLPPFAQRLDTDGNGVVDESERQAGRAQLLERWDADADGRLSREERRRARKAGDLPPASLSQKRAQAERVRAAKEQYYLKLYDADGDGKVSQQELSEALEGPAAKRAAERYRQNLERYDANGDGKLDEDEHRRARIENGLVTRKDLDAVRDEEREKSSD